ncbi:DUF3592 domain-containing protein [Kitasatospora sp. NPDC092948]|uniref:DUF3592 domain-containing protein n=1 Tax=Kitasatospora sp. NPDC092948 TaxID=3364088 RepID=UPI00380E01CA
MTDHGPSTAGILASLAFVALGIVAGIANARQVDRVRRTFAEGLAAEAVVLATYKTESTSGVGDNRSTTTTHHTILAFRTLDGREFRLDERNGRRRAVGDRIEVRYLPERPDRAVAVDRGPGEDIAGWVLCILLIAGGLVGLAISLSPNSIDVPNPRTWIH